LDRAIAYYCIFKGFESEIRIKNQNKGLSRAEDSPIGKIGILGRKALTLLLPVS
jgi:hypothetical protein